MNNIFKWISVLLAVVILSACSDDVDPKEEKREKAIQEAQKNLKNEEVTTEDALASEEVSTEEIANHYAEYKAGFRPIVNQQINKIDDDWDAYWVSTFDANNGPDDVTAYSNLTKLENEIENSLADFNDIEPPSYFTKKDKELLDQAKTKISTMLIYRKGAIKDAKEVIASGDVTASDLSRIETVMEQSNNSMLQGLAKLTELDLNYGYDYSQDK